MSALRQGIAETQVALALLTRLPVGRLPDPAPTPADAAWAYPLVGLLSGALSGVVYLAASPFLPALTSAVLAVGTGVLLTGALHEDGLADVADGFGGGRDRAAKLEIMRDSRIGSYGVVALILVLALTASAVAGTPATAQTLVIFATIGAISRAAMLIPMTLLAPARADGLGQSAALAPGWRVWIGAGGAAVLALIALPWALIAVATGTAFMTWLARRQIGGQTGDVLGATQKIAETLAWLTAAAVLA